MKIQKLDNRFKLKKQGIATHMIQMGVQEFLSAEKIMNSGYGQPRLVTKTDRRVPNDKDWYYTYWQEKNFVPPGADPATVFPSEKMVFRIFFRREEQATFLLIQLADEPWKERL